MMHKIFATFIGVAVIAISNSVVLADDDGWSDEVNGLQARLVLVEKEPLHGVRWLVPYLELRNVRHLINAMEVDCSRERLKVELVDKDGNTLRSGSLLRRSGPVPGLSTVILPYDSSMRISLECRNWGISPSAAMVSTDSGAWNITEAEKGKVYLTATLVGEKGSPHWKTWYGKLRFPLIPVDWADQERE